MPPAEPAPAERPPDPPWRRGPNPLAKALLWTFTVGILAAAVFSAWATLHTGGDPVAVFELDVRTDSAVWRGMTAAGLGNPPKALATNQPQAAHPLVQWRQASLDSLWTRAQAIDVGDPARRARELAVVHEIATEAYADAAKHAKTLPSPSAELRAALAGLPADLTPSLAAEAPVAALEHAGPGAFGRAWGDWTRNRVRLHIARRVADSALKGDSDRALAMLRRLNADLADQDSRVAAVFATLTVVVGLGANVGFALAAYALIRALAATLRRQPPWQWLRDRYPGLPNDNPYLRDSLTPWLGLAMWLGIQGAASVGMGALFGRHVSGFAVLLSTMFSALGAAMAISLLSTARVPVQGSARLGGDPAAPFWRASTAALRAWAVLLPAVAVTGAVAALLLGEPERAHPLAQLAADHPDPVTFVTLGLAGAVIGPLSEELLFRGLILRYFRQRFGTAVALAVSSVLFAAMHLSPEQMPPYVVLGLGFGLVYVWVGNLWASVIVHALWNTGSLAMTICVAMS